MRINEIIVEANVKPLRKSAENAMVGLSTYP